MQPKYLASDPTAVERARRYRQRQRRGLLLTPVELPGELVERMIDMGVISDGESEDRRRLGEAMVTCLREFVRLRRRA